MLKNLILVRHAKAGQFVGQKDFERALTPEGERDARHIGRWMSTQFQNIDTIITSSALRARTTADIVSEGFKQSHVIVPSDEIYEASVRTLLAIINNVDIKYKNVMLVGHNPSISYFAEYLTGSPLGGMEAASAVIIKIENLDWKEIGQNSGTLKIYKVADDT